MLVMLLWLIFVWLLALASLILFNFGLARFFERLVPPQGRFIEVDGVRLHVVDSGIEAGPERSAAAVPAWAARPAQPFQLRFGGAFPGKKGGAAGSARFGFFAKSAVAVDCGASRPRGESHRAFEFGQTAGGRTLVWRRRRIGAGARSSRMRRRAGAGRAPDPSLRAAASHRGARRSAMGLRAGSAPGPSVPSSR